MNKNGTNPGMNVEDYEDMAVQKSNAAKRILVGGAAFVGGAAVAGGAAYAATQSTAPSVDETLTAEDVVSGAEAGSEYAPAEPEAQEPQAAQATHTTSTHTTTERIYVVEQPAADVKGEEPQNGEESPVSWDETTHYYADGEKLMSVESGTVQGHDFKVFDTDNDNLAEVVAIDTNDNGIFEQDEIITMTDADDFRMGHETAKVTNEHYSSEELDKYSFPDGHDEQVFAQNGKVIRNNFEDEKTGDSYYGDFAENNPDYNPQGNVNSYDAKDSYLAENDSYHTEDHTYSAEMHSDGVDPDGGFMAGTEIYAPDVYTESAPDPSLAQSDMAEAESYAPDVYTESAPDPSLAQSDMAETESYAPDVYTESATDPSLAQSDTDIDAEYGTDMDDVDNNDMCENDDEYNHMTGDEMLIG